MRGQQKAIPEGGEKVVVEFHIIIAAHLCPLERMRIGRTYLEEFVHKADEEDDDDNQCTDRSSFFSPPPRMF